MNNILILVLISNAKKKSVKTISFWGYQGNANKSSVKRNFTFIRMGNANKKHVDLTCNLVKMGGVSRISVKVVLLLELMVNARRITKSAFKKEIASTQMNVAGYHFSNTMVRTQHSRCATT